MSKKILLKKYTLDDLEIRPQIFNNENDGYAKLYLVDLYGVLYTENDEVPYYFMHHFNPNKNRFSSISKLGNGYNSLQIPLHIDDLVQKNDEIIGYRKIDGKSFGIDCKAKDFSARFYEDKITLKDAEILNLEGKLFPTAIFKHADEAAEHTQMTQMLEFSGILDGKSVKGIGNFELMYIPEKENRELNDYASYIYAHDIGIREDGRHECSMVYTTIGGNSNAIYYLEGEEPVISSNVEFVGEWEKLPYVDDDTCTYKNIVIKYSNKEIHFEGKYGQKGLTAYPRIELSGQSQQHGTWYEGNVPYKHKLNFTFHENMNVYVDVFKKANIKVK